MVATDKMSATLSNKCDRACMEKVLHFCACLSMKNMYSFIFLVRGSLS